jgi:hypothetical protein
VESSPEEFLITHLASGRRRHRAKRRTEISTKWIANFDAKTAHREQFGPKHPITPEKTALS